jgi:hypothetical protein
MCRDIIATLSQICRRRWNDVIYRYCAAKGYKPKLPASDEIAPRKRLKVMTANDKPTYCRLSVILATDVAKGVIFRRGPSLWTQLILWNTRTNTFTEGQWFKGNIYPDRADLSPDGSKLVYFAAKHNKRIDHESGYTNTWTAISKPPYFTALALWSEWGTYGGGGIFLNNNTVCLRSAVEPHKNHQPPEWFRMNTDDCAVQASPAIWRMERNGWFHRDDIKAQFIQHDRGFTYDPPLTYQHNSDDGQFQLLRRYRGYGGKEYGDPTMLSYV